MSGAQGNALDWALALAKAPGERHALRHRALPEEIETLIQIAGGSAGEALSRAVARTGESPSWIVEASRFYLREVLFFPEADAYRLLGVAHDADHASIRSHHRLLQLWLHPDRSSDEDAVFAARVNAAWDQVRQPDRRAAYDRSHPAQAAQPAGDSAYPLRAWIPVSVPEVEEVPTEERWRRRVPLLVLLSACIGLGVITVQHQQRLDEVGSLPLARASEDATPVLRVPQPVLAPPPVVATRRDPAASKPVPAMKQARGILADDMTRDDPFQTFTVAEDPDFAIPADPADVRAAAAPIPAALPARRSPENAPQERLANAVASVAPTLPPASTLASTPVKVRSQPPPQQVSATVVPPKARAPEPVLTASANPSVSAVALPPPWIPDPQRVVGAQQVGQRLLAYLAESGTRVPPIWDSLSSERAAAQIRTSIARGQGPRFETPTWRVADADAALQASLRFRDGREGRLRARLVWREQRWLVSDLSMEQDW